MKKLFLVLSTLFFFSGTFFAQIYTEQTVNNPSPMTPMIIEVEKGEVFYVLNDNSTQGVVKTYLLINQTSPLYVMPNTPQEWSVLPLYKPNKATFNFNLGSTFKIVLDENGCSYLEFH
jgi:hypothetical protein